MSQGLFNRGQREKEKIQEEAVDDRAREGNLHMDMVGSGLASHVRWTGCWMRLMMP
jgi:hypothetical protein